MSLNNPTFPVTGSYAQAFFSNSSTWSTTSTTFADPVNSGGNTLTIRQSSGVTLAAGAAGLCGVTFTPASSTAVYMIWAQVAAFNTTAGDYFGLTMTDGTTTISAPGVTSEGNNGYSYMVTLGGIYAPATASAVTVKLQMLVNASTGNITAAGVTGTTPVEWTVLRIF
jgi:hypothetical protein